MDNNELIKSLTVLLGLMIGILVVLCIVFLVLKIKTGGSNKEKKSKNEFKKNNLKGNKNSKTTSTQVYNKQSIFKFMEFDNIRDNMIIQKNGKRFLMVIGCQGINYDLMSGLEKNSVEQGFLQFLNTLRYPIQIYVQTRTVNLGSSINTYKQRVDEIAKEYANKQIEYNQKVRSGKYEKRELDKEYYELARQRNLYEYGVDIINNTEKMSLNKNILSKHYYIVISYYSEEASDEKYDKEEVLNIAFSELYTKAQTLINALAVCGINSKVLDSVELAELLYVAYNRDESEKLDLTKALNAGYEDLYSTAPNVFEKRIKELDIKIQEEATKKANEVLVEAVEEDSAERQAKAKEAKMDELIDEFAKILINDNKKSFGPDVAEKAIEKIDTKSKERKAKEKEGEEKDVKKTKTTRRTTKRV
mgnify:CR=1 FL=1